MRKVLSSGLCRQSCELMDSRVARCQRETGGRGASGRRRLRERGFHVIDGESIPQVSNSSDSTTTTSRLKRPASHATRDGVADRVTFEVAKAKEFPGKDYDFVAVFDCLHDMGDPIGAAAHVRQSLAKDGTWMIVEPFANDQLKDNLNPVGRVYYSFSTLLCTPCSRSQEVGLCLGCAGGRDTNSGGCYLGRVQPLPPRHGNTLQHSLRSSALT